jgi:TPP-dependent pyruvate/acetoin dehydrogenase alpha subunit
MSDPGLYRTRDEVAEWRRRDPVAIAKRRLADELGAGVDELDAIATQVKDEIADAVTFAEDSPPADEYLPYVIKD